MVSLATCHMFDMYGALADIFYHLFTSSPCSKYMFSLNYHLKVVERIVHNVCQDQEFHNCHHLVLKAC